MSILDELFQEMKNVYLNPPKSLEDLKKTEEELEYLDWEICKLESQKLELIEQLEEKLRKENTTYGLQI